MTGSCASTRSGGCGAAAQPAEGTGCALLIETRAAIGDSRRSAKVEGIDFLSTELGVSGHLNAPRLVEAITHAERVIGEAGIAPGGGA